VYDSDEAAESPSPPQEDFARGATMNSNDRGAAPDTLRPESQPHGTTEDQIHEMESEGQGGAAEKDAKPKSIAPPNNATVSVPATTMK
jgi:hypothetical protein